MKEVNYYCPHCGGYSLEKIILNSGYIWHCQSCDVDIFANELYCHKCLSNNIVKSSIVFCSNIECLVSNNIILCPNINNSICLKTKDKKLLNCSKMVYQFYTVFGDEVYINFDMNCIKISSGFKMNFNFSFFKHSIIKELISRINEKCQIHNSGLSEKQLEILTICS